MKIEEPEYPTRYMLAEHVENTPFIDYIPSYEGIVHKEKNVEER